MDKILWYFPLRPIDRFTVLCSVTRHSRSQIPSILPAPPAKKNDGIWQQECRLPRTPDELHFESRVDSTDDVGRLYLKEYDFNRLHCLILYRFKSNRTLCVYPQSTLYFLCPNTATAVVSLQINFLSPLYENLWLVNKESYERCEVNKTVDRKLRVCDKPFELKSYRIIFRKYSAGDDPLFTPGEDYYFIGM